MSTFFGLTIFSALAAMLVDKVFNSVVDTASAVTQTTRAAMFAGTWTLVSTAFGLRAMNKSAKDAGNRVNTLRNFLYRKDK